MAAMTSAEINTYIRTVLELSTSKLSDTKLNLFINKWITYYDNAITEANQWFITYNSTIDALRAITIAAAISTTASGASGSVTQRLEQRGSEKIQVYYSDSTTTVSSYQELLDLLLENPDYIHPSLKSSSLNIFVGGVSQQETSTVKQDSDSRSSALGIGWMFDDEYNTTGTSPSPSIYPKNKFGSF